MQKLLLFLSFLFLILSRPAFTQVAPPLGDADQFSILGANVTNTGPTIVYAKVGSTPGTIVGLGNTPSPGLATGGIHSTDNGNGIVAQFAMTSAKQIYSNLESQAATQNLSSNPQLGSGFTGDIEEVTNGMVLKPGVYKFDGNATLSGKLVLEGQGDPNAVFIFQIAGDLIYEPSTAITLQGQTLSKNVFFQIGGNILPGLPGPGNPGSQSVMQGNYLAKGNIILNDGTSVIGRLFGVTNTPVNGSTSTVSLNRNTIFLPTIIVADLSLSKAVSAAPYNIGSTVTYTITVRNNSLETATSVRVNEKLDSKLAFDATNPSSFSATRIFADGTSTIDNTITYNPTTGVVNINILGPRQSVVITIRAQITAAGTIPNTATVIASEVDPNPGDNTDNKPIVVPPISADLSILKAVTSPGPYNVGTRLTYTITARNIGPDNATGAFVTDILPLNFLRSPQITASTGTFTYNAATGEIVWSIGAIAPGATRTLTVSAEIYAAGNIVNTAIIGNTQGETQVDQVPGNNTSTVITPSLAVPLADLDIDKSIITTGPYTVGQEVTYRIVIRNLGPDPATGVQVTEVLPGQLAYVSNTATAGTYSSGSGLFTVGDLASGASATLEITARILTSGKILNTVSVTGDQVDPNLDGSSGGGDNTDEVEICVLPPAPVSIAGPQAVCPNQANIVYSVPVVPGATRYTFTFPTDWVTSASNTNVAVVDVAPSSTSSIIEVVVRAGAASGVISVVATNVCGSGTAASLNVVSGTPAQAGAITLVNNPTLCEGSQVIFSVPAVAGATSYTWTFAGSGWTIVSGNGTTSIVATVGSGTGTVTVTADNACGSGAASTLTVTPITIPQAGTITLANSNPSLCAGNQVTFSIQPVAGATSYTWALTGSGWTILSGDGTTSIVARAGTEAGRVSVTANNTCGSGLASSLDVPAGIPAQLGTITLVNNNPSLCAGNQVTFNIPAVAGATSYTWTITGAGWAIVSGNSTNSIVATTGTGVGTVTVTANNACGSSATSSLNVNSNNLLPVGAITLVNNNPNLCTGNQVAFTIQPVTGATSYNWAFTGNGWTIVSGQGTTSIVATAGTGASTLTVTPSNACGTGAAGSLNVNASSPVSTGPITLVNTNPTLCSGNQVTFNTQPVAGATSYTWAFAGGGWTIVSGQGTTSIVATVGTGASIVSVIANSTCGQGTPSTLNVTPVPTPGPLAGIIDNSSSCAGLAYSIAAVPGATTYTWTVTNGFTITQGQGTQAIKIEPTSGNKFATSGTVSVTASNGGCTSAEVNLTFDATKAGTDLFFPNTFSPNGDGIYDTWQVRNILNFPDNDVVIFNRWGSEVYRKVGYKNDWAASGLEQGTYFYVFRVKGCNGQNQNYKGSITIYR